MTSQGLALAFNGGIRPHPQVGGSFGSFLKGASNFVKDNHLISNGAKIASVLGVPHAGTVGAVAKSVGLGKKKKKMSGKGKKTKGKK